MGMCVARQQSMISNISRAMLDDALHKDRNSRQL